ncbi:MAG: type I restriction endonuclease, partial [Clostridia bacterium]
VQIELKRSGIDLTEAFNQIIRYKQEAFDKNIFKMLQLFIISNETLTKYFSNNIKLNPKFAFN